MGYGKAYFIENPNEKKAAADILMNQYRKQIGVDHTYGDCLSEVCFIKIEISSVSGKESLEKHLD